MPPWARRDRRPHVDVRLVVIEGEEYVHREDLVKFLNAAIAETQRKKHAQAAGAYTVLVQQLRDLG